MLRAHSRALASVRNPQLRDYLDSKKLPLHFLSDRPARGLASRAAGNSAPVMTVLASVFLFFRRILPNCSFRMPSCAGCVMGPSGQAWDGYIARPDGAVGLFSSWPKGGRFDGARFFRQPSI